MTASFPGTCASSPLGLSLATALAVLLGCAGKTSTHKTTPAAAAAGSRKGAPKAGALRDFDAGLRALRLGGPEANERAAESFTKATAADPSLWEAWYDLGVVKARSGDDRAAVVAYGRALGVNAGHRPSLLARAESLRRLRRVAEAKADYEAAIQADADDLQTRLRLASLLREAGDTDGSVKVVREVLRRNAQGKDLADANVELGLVYMAAGKEELAELVLGKAAALDPKNPRVWNALGLLALKQGKDQEAFQRLDHATDLDPAFRDARFNKASVLLDAGDYAQAKSELGAALKGESGDVEALIAFGVAERGLGDYKGARESWEKVLVEQPMNADALFDLAVLQMDFLKDEAKARELLARYLAAAPDDHPRQKDARSRLGELGAAATPATTPTPTPAPGAKQP
jgi:tetratricopeptide (TPR) repeat protein